ncbi:MAG: LysR substrate-binding domain-containing protein [Alphaproteobacteria bacterium]|nr:LysR substrate-binding domain-containing protein [Alphaproteobacteria bacterium]
MHSKPRPSLESFQALLAAAETGSFSAAAEALNITHGSVSRRVSAVEAWAGRPIFRRHGRGVQVTLDGQSLIGRIEQALAMLDDSARLAERDDELDIVRVSVVPSFARLWLLPNTPALEGMPQDLVLDIDISYRVASLSESRIAIRHGRGHWPGVSVTPLFQERLIPVAAPDIADNLRGSSPDRVLDYPLILDSPDSIWKIWFASCDIDYARRPQDRTFADYDMTLLAAAQGLGIAMLRDPFGRQVCDSYGLRPVSDHQADNLDRFFLVTRLGHRSDATERLSERLIALTAS